MDTAAEAELAWNTEGLTVVDGGLHRAGVPVSAGDVVLLASVVAPDDRLADMDAHDSGQVAEIDDADERRAVRQWS